MKAIIPFKKENAKSGLGGFLSKKEREEFALSMLKDVLYAVSGSKIEEVEVISTCSKDEIIEELKSDTELRSALKFTVRENRRGLNEALNDVITKEKEPVLIIMADLPLATFQSINELIEHKEEVVIAPGREGGTNALLLRRPSAFFVSYYGISCSKHIKRAEKENLSYAIYDSFFISTDIDDVKGLIELLIHGKGFSSDYLRRIGVVLQMDKDSKTRAMVDRS